MVPVSRLLNMNNPKFKKTPCFYFNQNMFCVGVYTYFFFFVIIFLKAKFHINYQLPTIVTRFPKMT